MNNVIFVPILLWYRLCCQGFLRFSVLELMQKKWWICLQCCSAYGQKLRCHRGSFDKIFASLFVHVALTIDQLSQHLCYLHYSPQQLWFYCQLL